MKYVLRALFIIIALPGCAEIKLTLPAYTPVNTEEYSGAIAVNDFAYVPPEGVQQNEIRETAMGRLYLTEDVGQYFAKRSPTRATTGRRIAERHGLLIGRYHKRFRNR
jgi:hypothetical protein